MSNNTVHAVIREKNGKGPTRRLRMEAQLPAVVYGKGQETLSISLNPRDITKILRGPLKRNVVIDLEIPGTKRKRSVMVKERQIHPIKRNLIHVDFVEVDEKSPVTVQVPVNLVGKSESVTLGGKLDHVLTKMRVACLPKDIPASIDVDVSNLKFGSTHTADITLPAGLTLKEKPRVVILTIKKPRGTKEGEEATPGAKPEGKADAKGKK